jgi:hypothetical protein
LYYYLLLLQATAFFWKRIGMVLGWAYVFGEIEAFDLNCFMQRMIGSLDTDLYILTTYTGAR